MSATGYIVIAVIIVIALTVLVTVLVYKSHHPPAGGFDEPCSSGTPTCGSGLTCSNNICKRSNGQQCTQDADCVSGSTCPNKTCVASTGGLNEPCGITGNTGGCNTGLQCLSGYCKAITGQPCTKPGDCISGLCPNGFCSAGSTGTGTLGQVCSASTPCIAGLSCSSGYCQFSQTPTGSPYSYCQASGPQCSGSTLCRSNVCLPTNQTFGSACSSTNPCQAPTECNLSPGLCLYRPNGTCGTASQCPSGFSCPGGQCAGPSGTACYSGTQCLSGVCTNQTILVINGQPSVLPVGVTPQRLILASQMTGRVVFQANGLYQYINGWTLLPGSQTWSSGSTTYTLVDAASDKVSKIVAIYQMSGGQGTAIFSLLGDLNLTRIPIGTPTGQVMVGGVQYDPKEIDINGNGDIVMTAVPHATPSAQPVILVLPSGASSATIVTGLVTGTPMKPRYYQSPITGVIGSQEFAYQVGSGIYLAGSLSGFNYLAPSGSTILDYDVAAVYPMVTVIANIAATTSQLYRGIIGYGGSALINPIPGYITGITTVGLLLNDPFQIMYTSSGYCR